MLKGAYMSSLEFIKSHKLKTIALCGISTGNYKKLILIQKK